MNRLILVFIFASFLSAQSYAGFWTDVAASATANALTERGVPSSRIKKINTYLWNMHKTGNYEEGYEFYLKYLENNTEDISYLDTVAHVYLDNGNKKKAIKIYKQRILPWVVLENERTKEKFESYYNKMQNK